MPWQKLALQQILQKVASSPEDQKQKLAEIKSAISSYDGKKYILNYQNDEKDAECTDVSIIKDLAGCDNLVIVFTLKDEKKRDEYKNILREFIQDNKISAIQVEDGPDDNQFRIAAKNMSAFMNVLKTLPRNDDDPLLKPLHQLADRFAGNSDIDQALSNMFHDEVDGLGAKPAQSVMDVKSIPSNEWKSFKEWLRSEYKVIHENEHILPVGTHFPYGVNFLFETEEDAKFFLNKMKPILVDQKSFKDRVSSKIAVFVNSQAHAGILSKYKEYQSTCKPRSSNEIQAQIDAMAKRIALLKDDKKSDIVNRVDKLNLLALNVDMTGWQSHPATSAIHLALNNFIAFAWDRLSKGEREQIQSASREIMQDNGDVGGRIKQDSNFLSMIIRDAHDQKHALKETDNKIAVINAFQLLDGVKNRVLINQTTPFTTDFIAKSHQATFPIMKFFPDADGSSETDSILLDSGKMITHRTLIEITKKGVDAKGVPVAKGVKPACYRFYLTEYNAGAGLAWKDKPLADGKDRGVPWTVATYEIFPVLAGYKGNKIPEDGVHFDGEPVYIRREVARLMRPWKNKNNNVNDYYRAMCLTLFDIILAHRMCMLYKPTESIGIKGDEQKHTESGGQWKKWHDRLKVHQNEKNIIPEMSLAGAPQISGNCTVMSLKVWLDSRIGSLSEEFWLYTKQNDVKKTLSIFEQKNAELKAELVCALQREGALVSKQNTATKAVPDTKLDSKNASKQVSTPIISPMSTVSVIGDQNRGLLDSKKSDIQASVALFEIPKSLTNAIERIIKRFETDVSRVTIGMNRKRARLQQALQNAKNVKTHKSIDDFLNYKKNDTELSLSEVLQEPRKWPGMKPLYGVTDSWAAIQSVINALNNTSKVSYPAN